MILPVLILQWPHPRSKPKDHTRCLGNRMAKWLRGDINSLLHECLSIPSCLNHRKHHTQEVGHITRTFNKLVSLRNLKAAARLIKEQNDYGCLQLNNIQPDGRKVMDHLLDKHPPRTPVLLSAISDHPPAIAPHSVIFDQIDSALIRSISQQMDGSAGPSGLDAHTCMAMLFLSQCLGCLVLFGGQANQATATPMLTHMQFLPWSRAASLPWTNIQESEQSESVRCWMPHVKGYSQLHTMTSKRLLEAYSYVLVRKQHVKLGYMQWAGIHAMRNLFEDDGVEAVLLVDASNAFSSLNREASLRNICIHYRVLAAMLTNIYKTHCMLFIDANHILSQEGTTQGDLLAMTMYAIAPSPYLQAAGRGQCHTELVLWWCVCRRKNTRPARRWDSLVSWSPHYGYNPNPGKTWLVVKHENFPAAEEHFRGFGVNISTQGHRHFGVPLGLKSFVEEFIRDKISC